MLVVGILGVYGGEATLEGGLVDGLRVADRGTVLYELRVGSQRKTIEVGPAEVLMVDELEARAAVPAGTRSGYSVRFELPADRLALGEHLELASSRWTDLEGDALDKALRSWIDRVVPTAAGLDEAVIRILEERRAGTAEGRDAGSESKPSPDVSGTADMVVIPAGRYLVGRLREEATFFNQQPRFEVELEAFLIDPVPVSRDAFPAVRTGLAVGSVLAGGHVAGVSWHEADAFCRSRGGVLPSEFEWEVAMGTGLARQGRLEWTSSWYRPYPGNRVEEPEYGERMKVIRGAAEPDDLDPRRRLFAAPETRDSRLGFRCSAAVR